MSRRPGLKEDEKRERLLALFHESKSVYNLKELEPLASKTKGITSQSVKGILEMLVADGLVEQEKIGQGTFFWSFPSKAVQIRKNKIADLRAKVQECSDKEKAMKAQLNAARADRQPTKERKVRLELLHDLRRRKRKVEEEGKAYEVCDPERIKKLKEGVAVATEAANRWTNNLYLIHKHFRDRGQDWTFEQMLEGVGLPKDMDMIE